MIKQRHHIGPLTDEEQDFLISEYKEGGSVRSIAIKMVRPEKFLYRQLETLGIVYPRGSGIIICVDCQVKINVKNRKTRRCQDCSSKRHMEKITAYKKDSLKFNPEALKRDIARRRANYALVMGKLIRPERCELCNDIPVPMKDGRSGLRMDHYMGYDSKYWTTVRFVCIPCDSKQIIERGRV